MRVCFTWLVLLQSSFHIVFTVFSSTCGMSYVESYVNLTYLLRVYSFYRIYIFQIQWNLTTPIQNTFKLLIGFALCNLDFVLLLDILHRPYKHPTYKPYTAFERPYKPISGGRSLDKPLYIAL